MSETDETDEIADFMSARLDELEARAEANASSIPGEWKRVICDPVIGAFGGQTRDRNIARGMYLADMSDPAVVGASVAADRAMLPCGGCRFTTALSGAWSVEDGRLVFRAALDPLARRGPSMGSCCEGHHEGVEVGALEFKRVTVDGRPLADEEFAAVKASAESPGAWDEEMGAETSGDPG